MKGSRNSLLAAGVFLVFITCVAHGAQWGGYLSGPVFGYIFDNSSSRWYPLQGVPGSATVGVPIDPGFRSSQALLLDARHAIVSTENGDELRLLDMETRPPLVTTIARIPGIPANAVASAQGTAAAFYFPETRQAYIVTGLPEKPALVNQIEISPAMGTVTLKALGNDAQVLVFAVHERQAESLYSWTPASTFPRFLMASASIGGVALTANNSAIVADREANAVVAFWDAGGAAVRQFLVGDADGVSNPAGVVVSTNNRIYIANATGSVLVLDHAGRPLRLLSCPCRPIGLYPVRDSLFRLTDRIDRTLFLVDARSNEERILFVPPGRSQQ
jgi:hypothetical protein